MKASSHKPDLNQHTGGPSAALWVVVLTALCALLACLLWFPISRLNARDDGGSNEGFNCYWQQAAANGFPLYGKPPTTTHVNYPPLSFHLIAWLGGFMGDRNIAGRWISFLAYLGIAGAIAAIVFQSTAARRHAVYAALAWLIWLADFDPARIGFNDPHLLGVCLGLLGLFCFFRGPDSARWLCASGVLFALSLFAKQSLVAFPAAVAVTLFLASRKRFAIWAGAAVGSAALLLLLTFQLDGVYFLQHLSMPRSYSLASLIGTTIVYIGFFQGPLAAALILIFHGPPRILLLCFLFANGAGIVYTSGAGAGLNHFYDAMISVCLVVGCALPAIEGMALRVPHAGAFLAVLLTAPFFMSSLAILPRRVLDDLTRFQSRSQLEASFAAAANFVRAQPGSALCEDLPVCYAAGKPITWDTFVIDQLIQTRRVDEGRVLGVIANRGFAVIELDVRYNQPVTAREHISPGFVKQVLAAYQLATRTPEYALFTPKPR